MINAPWQKKYGYPYVELSQFTRKEQQEIFLEKFYFEYPGDTTGFYKGLLGIEDRIVLQDNLRRYMQEIRCILSVGSMAQ